MPFERGRSRFFINLLGTVDLLRSVNVSWTEEARNKIFSSLHCEVPLETQENQDGVESLVVLSVLALLQEPSMNLLNRLEGFKRHPEPWSWAVVAAILLDDVPLVKLLLEREPGWGAEKNVLVAEPLRVAVVQGHYDIVTLLLENGGHLGCDRCYGLPGVGERKTLQCAAVAGDVRMVEILRGPEYRLQTDNMTLEAAMNMSSKMIHNHRDKESAYVKVMKCLLETSDPADQSGLREYAIQLGIHARSKAMVCMVLDLGHDPDLHPHHSPLCQAAWAGDLDIVNILLDHGATTRLDGDFDAIKNACVFGQPDVLEVLFQRAMTVAEYGHRRMTVNIHIFCHQWGDEEVALKLWKTCCNYGLDLTAEDCGQRALMSPWIATGPDWQRLREFLTFTLELQRTGHHLFD